MLTRKGTPALLSCRRPGAGDRGRVPQTRGPPVGGSRCVQPHFPVRRLPSLTQEGRSHPGSVQGPVAIPSRCVSGAGWQSWERLGLSSAPGGGVGGHGGFWQSHSSLPSLSIGIHPRGVVAASFPLRPSRSLIWGNLGSEECDVPRPSAGGLRPRTWPSLGPAASLRLPGGEPEAP